VKALAVSALAALVVGAVAGAGTKALPEAKRASC
jgi:hypothetical protein